MPQHQIDKLYLMHREHDPIHFASHAHYNAGRNYLRAADPVNGLVVAHDSDLRHVDTHLAPQHAGQCGSCVSRADAPDLPDGVQFQNIQLIKIFQDNSPVLSIRQVVHSRLHLIRRDHHFQRIAVGALCLDHLSDLSGQIRVGCL